MFVIILNTFDICPDVKKTLLDPLKITFKILPQIKRKFQNKHWLYYDGDFFLHFDREVNK